MVYWYLKNKFTPLYLRYGLSKFVSLGTNMEFTFVDINCDAKIWDLMKSIKKESSPVTIWQTIKESQKEYVTQILNVTDGRGITLVPVNKNDRFDFDTKDSIYFKSEHRNIIFKSKILDLQRDLVAIAPPEVVKLNNQRIDERRIIDPLEEIRASFYLLSDHGKKNVEVRHRLVQNISNNGLALKIRELDLSFFSPGDTIVVNGESIAKDTDSVAKIRHLYVNTSTGKKVMSFGIELIKPLEEEKEESE
jgi:hypothetical protein